MPVGTSHVKLIKMAGPTFAFLPWRSHRQFHAMPASWLLVSPDSALVPILPPIRPTGISASALDSDSPRSPESITDDVSCASPVGALQVIYLFIFFWATVEVKSCPRSWDSNTSGDCDLIVLSFQQRPIPSSRRGSLVPICHWNLWVSLISKSLHLLSLDQEYCFWNIYPAYSSLPTNIFFNATLPMRSSVRSLYQTTSHHTTYFL